MIHRARIVFVLIATFTIAAGVSATGISEEPPQTRPLSIAFPRSVSSLPLLQLVADFPDDYSGAYFTDHPQALAQLVTGEIDVLATGFSVGYSRHQSAGDIVHLFTPVWGVSALMSSEPIEDFRSIPSGLVYAPFEGSPIDFYLKAVIEDAKLGDKLEIAYAPFPQAAALLTQGKAVGAVLVEPLASRLELAGSAHRVENLHDGWARVYDTDPRSPQVSLFAVGDRYGTRQPAYDLLVDRLATIVGEVRQSPAVFAQRYADELGFRPEEIELAISNTLFDTPSAATVRALIARYTELLGLPTPAPGFFTAAE